jgi:hypothetical protein
MIKTHFAFVFIVFFISSGSFASDFFVRPIPHHRPNQLDPRNGPYSHVMCGPTAITDVLQNFKWFDGYDKLYWAGNPHANYPKGDEFIYSQIKFLVPFLNTNFSAGEDEFISDPGEITEGLRKYFKQSGYSKGCAFVQGAKAFDAPEGKTLDQMQKPVSIEMIRKTLLAGYGVVINRGGYGKNYDSNSFARVDGHWLAVYGYRGRSGSSDPVLMKLLVANPWGGEIEYENLIAIRKKPNFTYPKHIDLALSEGWVDALVFFHPDCEKLPFH